MPPIAANDADAQAFDHQVLVFQVHFNRGELRVLGQEPDLAAFALEAFDGDFIADAGDDDLAITGFAGGVDGQQVAIEDAHVLHAHAVDPQQVVGARMEEGRVDVAGFLDVLLRQDRRTGGDTADDRQGRFVGLGFEARDSNTARGTGGHLDRAFASEGLEVFFRSVGGLEPQFQRNFRSCRRVAVVIEAALDKSQNLSLAWRQF